MRIEAISHDPLSTRLLRALNPVSLATNLGR